MKQLKINVEYQCSPLWISTDGIYFANLDVHDTDFRTELKQKIISWSESFENTYNDDYPPDSGFSSFELENIFENTGVKIWNEIKSNYSHIFDQVIFVSYILKAQYFSMEKYLNDFNLKMIKDNNTI